MIRRITQYTTLALALSVSMSACESSTAPDAGAGMGQAKVVLGQSSSVSQNIIADAVLDATQAPPVSLSGVSSVDVTITKVQALSAKSDTTEERSWVTLTLDTPVTVNLLTLPLDESNGLEIARGELPVGSYSHLRLFFSEATITFKDDIALGNGMNAVTLKGGTAYPLTIPSGQQTGIKVPTASFMVEEGSSTVRVSFDVNTSVKKILFTGSGLKMTPVMSAKGKKG